MGTARYLIGDTRQVLRTLPDNSVDLVLTSPPFLALRDYLPADHPAKPFEMGSEATPGEFIDALLDVIVECRRVLAPHGSICIELGDTYGGHDNRGRCIDEGRHNAKTRSVMAGAGWPQDKSLCLIPESFRWALAYGRNPFTGRTIQPWRVRNVVRWHRPNPPVGKLGDKFRPATSDLVIACTTSDRYFDLVAVRTPTTTPDTRSEKPHPRRMKGRLGPDGLNEQNATGNHPAGAPPLDTWIIPTQPYAGSHYASWPEQLCVKPIKAMCPPKVCTTCGRPSERIVETRWLDSKGREVHETWKSGVGDGMGAHSKKTTSATTTTTTIGWTDCGHNNTWRTGVVLDPFAGSGTTGLVSTGHGRDFIGIDLDPSNADLALERIGPLYLTVEHPEPKEAA